jgi:hypothetical protein
MYLSSYLFLYLTFKIPIFQAETLSREIFKSHVLSLTSRKGVYALFLALHLLKSSGV